jgi:hypothetical protein
MNIAMTDAERAAHAVNDAFRKEIRLMFATMCLAIASGDSVDAAAGRFSHGLHIVQKAFDAARKEIAATFTAGD